MIASFGAAPRPQLVPGMQVEMDGERQIVAQPDLGAQAVEPVAAIKLRAIGGQLQSPAMDQLEAAVIAVVARLQHDGALGLLGAPVDVVGIADRRGAHQRFELAMDDEPRR